LKKLKIIAIISGSLAIVRIVYPIVLKLILKYKFNYDLGNPYTASSVGFIGGDDGDTSIAVIRNNVFNLILKNGFTLLCAVISIVCIIAMKNKRGG